MIRLVYSNIKLNKKQFFIVVLYMFLSVSLVYNIASLIWDINKEVKTGFFSDERYRTFTVRVDITKQTLNNCYKEIEKLHGVEKLEIKNEYDIKVVANNLESLKTFKATIPNEKCRVMVNADDEFEIIKLDSLLKNLNLLIGIVSVSIFLTMSIIVFKIIHERSKEVALYKSVGYPNNTILRIFILEFLISQLASLFLSTIVSWCFSTYAAPFLLSKLFSSETTFDTVFHLKMFFLVEFILFISIISSSVIHMKSIRNIPISILIKE